MAHPEYIRQKAIDLRTSQGLTIDELAECLSISKTTIYYWVNHIPIDRKPATSFRSEAQKKGTLVMQDRYRKAREAAYAEGAAAFPELLKEPTFRDFVCMYIGEGSKYSRNSVAICNSDPKVVKLGSTWICRFTKNKIRYSIQYHADQSLEELRTFWSEYLGIDPEAVKFQRKSNSNQLTGRKWRSQYGVLAVAVGDTYLRAQLQAWIDLVKADWG
ncbi:MAG: helix-turn-helix transcriptional regulator [Thermoleophilia bacterium]|nr:helix-turn-helix transcriptional regulator [Thermoleophilia bacterium]